MQLPMSRLFLFMQILASQRWKKAGPLLLAPMLVQQTIV